MKIEQGIMTFDEWNKTVVPAVKSGQIKDISDELPDSFLMFGQTLRAKIEDGEGNKFYVSGWDNGKKGRVEISKV